MATPTNLGFPRIGVQRELKRALEAFWSGRSDAIHLLQVSAHLRHRHWQWQQEAGITHIPSNDFSLYDQVLDTTALLGAVPARFRDAGLYAGGAVDLNCYFAMARGLAPGASGADCCGCSGERENNGPATKTPVKKTPALEMTKWFDTNYHYLVPELEPEMHFELGSNKPLAEFREAKALGIHTRPVLLGPITWLLLSRTTDGRDPLEYLGAIVPIYEVVLQQLADAGADWVQIDEPALVLDLTDAQRAAFAEVFACLTAAAPTLKLLLATYFGPLQGNLATALQLPVAAVHVDLTRGEALQDILAALPQGGPALSLGLIDGRNIWRAPLEKALQQAEAAARHVGPDRLLIGPSCSLLHSPVDLDEETDLDTDLRFWLAFARQKLAEIAAVARGVSEGRAAIDGLLQIDRAAHNSRRSSGRIHRPLVQQRVAAIKPGDLKRPALYPQRRPQQQASLRLPLLPTTTIGSFPQTPEIRRARAELKRGAITEAVYQQRMEQAIREAIAEQEAAGLDLLVHGEPERNDMVEYFGEQLEGFTATRNGWVQSYGSRCVKPPIIYGDLERKAPMTVNWTTFAQGCTDRPVKGMLTGPVTILQWSFVRDDQPRSATCQQIALAIRDEVRDLEAAGIRAIQIDEPALREGLPLRASDKAAYLRWSVDAFRLATAVARAETQIHTHMCYCEFGDVMAAIAELDADVISIEASRSDMQLLSTFQTFRYPNEIGPGVWDIHSPRVPDAAEMQGLLEKALQVLTPEQLWVNPDCGLKTRRWEEVRPAIGHLVTAAQKVREQVLAGIAH